MYIQCLRMFSVLSAQSIATTKIAVIVCNQPELKREILCAPGSECDINEIYCVFDRKRLWNNIIEIKVEIILENIGLPRDLHENIISTIFLIGIRMLNWAEYHERALCLEREYSVNFLNCSFFTQLGIINRKKAADELIFDEYLSIQQRYKLACLYCFTDHINELYKNMTFCEREMFYNAQNPNDIDQPMIVKFWSYHLEADLDKLKGDKDFDQYLLELAVNCGNRVAVDYCLERAFLRQRSNAIIDAALEIVKVRTRINDFLIFGDERYFDNGCLWVPTDYYADILYSLLLKMSEDQRKEFFKNDIRGVYIEFEYETRYRALEYFLNWPYQNYFIELAKQIQETQPEGHYPFPEEECQVMFGQIFVRIEPHKKCLYYGEEKLCNYRELLKEFWLLSTDRFKRYVFNGFKRGVRLFIRLVSLTNFTVEDKEFIEIFLSSATVGQKENIIFSEEWRLHCIKLIKEEKWEILNMFDFNCFLSKEKTEIFMRELNFTKEIQRLYIEFILNDKWDSIHSFIRWSALSDDDINKLKKKIIHSQNGRKVCSDFLLRNLEAFDRFVSWCFPSEEEKKAFTKEFLFSSENIFRCENVLRTDQFEILNEVIYSCFSSEEDIKRLKKHIAYTAGLKICQFLITGDPQKYNYIEYYTCNRSSRFEGGKWQEVDDLLSWCFSSEREKSEFKKEQLYKEFGKEIHFNLIQSKQWKEAEFFFHWVGLSAEEIRQLKKETLFDYRPAAVMFRRLMSTKSEEFSDFGSKQEAIELFLKWFLTDEEMVLEFKDELKTWYHRKLTQEEEVLIQEFVLQ